MLLCGYCVMVANDEQVERAVKYDQLSPNI